MIDEHNILAPLELLQIDVVQGLDDDELDKLIKKLHMIMHAYLKALNACEAIRKVKFERRMGDLFD